MGILDNSTYATWAKPTNKPFTLKDLKHAEKIMKGKCRLVYRGADTNNENMFVCPKCRLFYHGFVVVAKKAGEAVLLCAECADKIFHRNKTYQLMRSYNANNSEKAEYNMYYDKAFGYGKSKVLFDTIKANPPYKIKDKYKHRIMASCSGLFSTIKSSRVYISPAV